MAHAALSHCSPEALEAMSVFLLKDYPEGNKSGSCGIESVPDRPNARAAADGALQGKLRVGIDAADGDITEDERAAAEVARDENECVAAS